MKLEEESGSNSGRCREGSDIKLRPLTYAARSIHLHEVQNSMVIRGSAVLGSAIVPLLRLAADRTGKICSKEGFEP
jgi:hypothetical protein